MTMPKNRRKNDIPSKEQTKSNRKKKRKKKSKKNNNTNKCNQCQGTGSCSQCYGKGSYVQCNTCDKCGGGGKYECSAMQFLQSNMHHLPIQYNKYQGLLRLLPAISADPALYNNAILGQLKPMGDGLNHSMVQQTCDKCGGSGKCKRKFNCTKCNRSGQCNKCISNGIYAISHGHNISKRSKYPAHGTKVLRLFHVTDSTGAHGIQQSGKMIRGQIGMFGAGIYFAESIHAAKHKAHHHGYLVVADVLVGRQLTVNNHTAGSFTFAQLHKIGYDSVYAPNGSGSGQPERVVYNYDQVNVIQITKIGHENKIV